MRRFLPRTFFGQLVLSTFIVQSVFLLAFVYYTIVTQRRIADHRSRLRLVQQMDRLAAAIQPDWARGDREAVGRDLELSRVAPTIDVARLTDLNGTTVAVTDSGSARNLDASERAILPRATGKQVFKIANGQLESVAPIVIQGKPVALLWLEPNHALSLNTMQAVVQICLTYGAIALLVNVLPLFLIVRGMTRPLRRLGEATRQLIENPDRALEFPLPVTSQNEAGELTARFNGMVLELNQRRDGLLETLALLDSMLGNAPIGFAFFDPELRYVRVNDFLARTHGLGVDQHEGRSVGDFYPAWLATRKEACIRQVFATGEAIRDVELSAEMPYAPGAPRSWLMHFYPVRTPNQGVRWVGAIVVEITERLQAEEALRKTEKLAATGRLAASIAHEINNPLESVTNLLYLLETHEQMDETAVQLVSTAQAELARVSEITQQTLRFYRQSTSPNRIDVTEVLQSLLVLYQQRINAARISVVRRFRGEPEVFGFGGELRQVFANLLGNALDAMPNGGRLLLSAHHGFGRRSDGAWSEGVWVTVADTGIGMSGETLVRVFEPFFTTKQATGTGLGLWISAEIIRKHMGTVRVRTRQGENSGTTFRLFFPNRVQQDFPAVAATLPDTGTLHTAQPLQTAI